MTTLLISWGLAAILGFAAHRASICTVRAVAEILSTRRAYCLLSFVKSVLWVLAVVLAVLWVDPALDASIGGFAPSYTSLLGGFMFGVGAALNGGCSFSTLARLADGQLAMLLTLCGFAVGVLIEAEAFRTGYLAHPTASPPLIRSVVPVAGMLALLLWVWASSELYRLWKTRPRDTPLLSLALSKQYRLSTAAAVMGLSNGLLYLVHGPWTYTGALRQGVEGLVIASETPTPVRLSLFAAMFTGMALSTWQRRSFRLNGRASPAWAVNFVGGMLMGAGIVLVPGGNDALILYSIPTLSSHALPAYVAMLAGIAVVILAMRVFTGTHIRIDCHADVCTSETDQQVRP